MTTALTTAWPGILFIRSRKFRRVLRWSCILAVSFPPLANATPAAAPNPTWNVDAPILFRAQAEPFDH
jgi:hypothetical protein